MKVSRLDLRVILLWVAIFQFYLPNEKVYYIYQFFVACFIFAKSFGKSVQGIEPALPQSLTGCGNKSEAKRS